MFFLRRYGDATNQCAAACAKYVACNDTSVLDCSACDSMTRVSKQCRDALIVADACHKDLSCTEITGSSGERACTLEERAIRTQCFNLECCTPEDPCSLSQDGVCSCEQQAWDEEDCDAVGGLLLSQRPLRLRRRRSLPVRWATLGLCRLRGRLLLCRGSLQVFANNSSLRMRGPNLGHQRLHLDLPGMELPAGQVLAFV